MKVFPCDKCNAIINSPEGLAAHKAIRHDKKWNKRLKQGGQYQWLDPEDDKKSDKDKLSDDLDEVEMDLAASNLVTNYRFF